MFYSTHSQSVPKELCDPGLDRLMSVDRLEKEADCCTCVSSWLCGRSDECTYCCMGLEIKLLKTSAQCLGCCSLGVAACRLREAHSVGRLLG